MPNRNGLTIRSADAADVDGLIELLQACGIEAPRGRLATNLPAVRQEGGVVLIADEWGPPSGVVALHWTTRLTAELKLAEVGLLLTHPERRRGGIARLLLKSASQAARAAGCGELVLDTPAELDGLRDFALATGFAPAGERLRRSLRKHG